MYWYHIVFTTSYFQNVRAGANKGRIFISFIHPSHFADLHNPHFNKTTVHSAAVYLSELHLTNRKNHKSFFFLVLTGLALFDWSECLVGSLFFTKILGFPLGKEKQQAMSRATKAYLQQQYTIFLEKSFISSTGQSAKVYLSDSPWVISKRAKCAVCLELI